MITTLQKGFKRQIVFILGFIGMLNAGVHAQSNLTVTTTQSTESCMDDGSATIAVNGGVPPYSVYWLQYHQTPSGYQMDTLATGLSASNLKPGYYQIRVTDSSLPEPLIGYHTVYIQATFSIRTTVTPATCAESDGKIVASISDSVNLPAGPYSFEWSNGVNHLNLSNPVDSLSNVSVGVYSLKVTVGNGCYTTSGEYGGTFNPEGIRVWGTSPITTTNSATPSNCFDGTATVSPLGGTAPYTFLWKTNPVQTGQTAIGLSPGYVMVTITDSVGCTREAYISVPAGPNYLQASSQISPAVCETSSGAINMTVSGGQSPYTFEWSNGASTEDLSDLAPGYYHVKISDNLGCSLTAYKYVPKSSPVHVTIQATAPGCNQSNGNLNTTVSGGLAPYTYSWNGGASTGSSYDNVPKGYYHVTVTDANGCKGTDYHLLQEPESCKARISGRVFNDLNGNCVADPGEGGLANIIVYTTEGHHYGSTDQQGYYSIPVESGNYTLKAVVPSFWEQACPQNPETISVNAANPGTNYANNHFYFAPDSVFNDLQVYVSSGPARPGFTMTWYITLRNAGTTSLSPTLEFTHDASLNYQYSNPVATAYNPASKTLRWDVPLLSPQASRSYYVVAKLPVNAVLGDSVRSSAQVSITGLDVTPANNQAAHARLITGSYDPNDKLVRPTGFDTDGKISINDTVFTYTIRFQNSGTDTAFTVVVRDTLDTDLNIPSFKMLGASHPLEYTLSGEGYLTFTFNNILLPDSNINEPASHGYISYRIKRRTDVPVGTQFKNTASIYFDFNPPIHTNTTVNTLYDATVSMEELPSYALSIWPNPSSSVSRLSFELPENSPVSIELYDIQGKRIYQRDLGKLASGSHQLELNSTSLRLAEGYYLVRLATNKGYSTINWMLSKD